MWDFVSAVPPLMLASFALGAFATERRDGHRGWRAELFVGGWVLFAGMPYAVITLIPGMPLAAQRLVMLLPILTMVVLVVFYRRIRRAEKGARPGGPLPK